VIPDSDKVTAGPSDTGSGKGAMMSAIDRLVVTLKAVFVSGRAWIREIIVAVTRRKPASISYRFLAHQVAVHFAGSDSTRSIVFSSADSAGLSSDTLLMVALFLHEELGSKVLLVDGSFTGGGVSERFGFTAEAGLSECLYGSGHNLNEYIKSTANPGVFVLPAGRISSQIRRPVDSQTVRSMLDELGQFDFVFIQQGSITLDTRYLIFAQLADLVLLYCEEGATMISDFEACQKLFREYGISNVGVILLEAGG
jgi:Mrp family chromosome partitioning ATPase